MASSSSSTMASRSVVAVRGRRVTYSSVLGSMKLHALSFQKLHKVPIHPPSRLKMPFAVATRSASALPHSYLFRIERASGSTRMLLASERRNQRGNSQYAILRFDAFHCILVPARERMLRCRISRNESMNVTFPQDHRSIFRACTPSTKC